jgi:hypothetical protein
MINWAEIGAIAGIIAILEAPLLLVSAGIWRWARTIDKRLDAIETRSKRVRKTDPLSSI